jgi:hypothetical protein
MNIEQAALAVKRGNDKHEGQGTAKRETPTPPFILEGETVSFINSSLEGRT